MLPKDPAEEGHLRGAGALAPRRLQAGRPEMVGKQYRGPSRKGRQPVMTRRLR